MWLRTEWLGDFLLDHVVEVLCGFRLDLFPLGLDLVDVLVLEADRLVGRF